MNKSLIVYYSRIGENYAGGRLIKLTVGNTAVVAGKLHELTGAALFRIDTVKQIDTVKPYPADYTETTRIARQELRSAIRPELKNLPDNIEAYDSIYLGYPNWWGTFPMAVFTFLEAFDLSGKTILPFCTHEGMKAADRVAVKRIFVPLVRVPGWKRDFRYTAVPSARQMVR